MDVFLMIRRKKLTIFTDAKDTTTVLELKKMIEGILKVAPPNQMLFNKDSQLMEDDKTLADYGLTSATAKAQCPAPIGLALRKESGEFEALDLTPYSSPPDLPDVMKSQETNGQEQVKIFVYKMGKRKGKCVKKNTATKQTLEPEHLVKAPHSFVIHRGKCSKDLMDLTKDFRKIMEPFTASQLKERKKNTIKDFLSVSGYLHVSHMMMFTETELGAYMRLARLPRGPTLTFRIHNYSLARDVISSLKKQYVIERTFKNAPLIVLNSFSGEGMHMKLMATMFQNMFPTINITTVKLKNIRRCVLMNYNPSTKQIDLRHYVIRATPVGLNKGTKKMVQGKIPNLNKCKDISEFFDKAALLSESEFEDDGTNQVVLPQKLASRGAGLNSKSAIRLVELGPRMSLQLIKVEDGLMDGEILFHELIEKTDEEKALIKKKREEKRRLKEKRKAQQDENVKRKEKQKEELKQKALEGIKKKKEVTENQRLMELAAAESQSNEQNMDEPEEDDAEYYRKEVGAEPEQDLFQNNPSRKRKSEDDEKPRGFKKMRLDKKLKKKFQKSQDTTGNKNHGDNERKNKFKQQGGKQFKNKDSKQKRDGKQFSQDGKKKFSNPRFKTKMTKMKHGRR
ncbi:protein Peter pan isoform X2 [Aricia agestis]|uniref:protein Peter pan isoform X2 n=1 Tax=Aricia agestis TaxID=91739 RepID=UPI001C207391|nr:protein Peter pan isoform X2 [Aricia agestis]